MTITDERLKEWITACNTERGILENTTVMQIGEALSELLLLREQKRRLVEDGELLDDCLVWCSGSADFGDGGKAREGWLRVVIPARDQHNALMKEIE